MIEGLLEVIAGAITAGFQSRSRRARALWFWVWIGVLGGGVGCFLLLFLGEPLAWIAAVLGLLLGVGLGVARYFVIEEKS